MSSDEPEVQGTSGPHDATKPTEVVASGTTAGKKRKRARRKAPPPVVDSAGPAAAGAEPDAASEPPAGGEPDPVEPEPVEPEPVEPEPVDTQPVEPEPVEPTSTAARGPELVDDPFVAADAAHGHHVDPVEGRAAWGRLLKMGRPRATRANLLVLLLAVVLGAAIAAQVQLTNERGLTELSQTDLVRVLDDVSLRSSRLDQQVRELESTRDRLQSGTGTSAEALEQAQKRVDTLGILAGTVGAEGPGITLRIADPDNQVTGPVILDLIQELRDGGAEVIDVGGVRVVASSFVGDSGGRITIDGTPIERPFVIKAIGDSKTLASAMSIPGGIVESVRQKGASATVTESEAVEVTSTHQPTDLTHAQPVE